jgi:hypothetical protein
MYYRCGEHSGYGCTAKKHVRPQEDGTVRGADLRDERAGWLKDKHKVMEGQVQE